MSPTGAVLAIDFSSPLASVAVAARGELLAADAAAPGDEGDLLRRLDAALAAAGVAPDRLAGVAALAGPGSFTGLRVACATALGLAQAWGMPAGGVSSLAALAWSAPAEAGRLLAAVDALRGEWFVQEFGPADADGFRSESGEATLWRAGDRLDAALDAVIAFDADRFAAACDRPLPALAAPPLAPAVARLASRHGWRWRAELLTRPSYLRAPAVSRPRG
jgi:tRNA threonylcarbamoyl adenosine modification protein YeaZ